ncbi:MAG: hypothetical protein GF308_18135 [Candidatus Heimdallarchaeota archaeon]|nr:hypothetical protein [Candidatus Heimdallarchaeota archaeon]
MVDRVQLLLNAQKALLGAIHPNIRGISVAWEEGTFTWRVYFDEEPNQEDKEEMSIACTETLAGLQEFVLIQEELHIVPYPKPIQNIGEWVYLRREK